MMKFKIVVPTYNAETWIRDCVVSIQNQVHTNFECVIINDASTDNTRDVLDNLDHIEADSRFTIVHNSKNVKALKNIVDGFNLLKSQDEPESVLMAIDGDDKLFSEYSLAIVNQAYTQTECLMSYGNHIHYPTGAKSNCEPIPSSVIDNNTFRDYKFVTSHLRTFKSKLWYQIRDEDLTDDDGNYYGVGWDVAFMMPMLEMSRERTLFIPNVLYMYNRFNPLSDDQIRQGDQHRVEMRVRKGSRYKRYTGS
jgi:glycosyltransferase involved in cell wall biosynthesis